MKKLLTIATVSVMAILSCGAMAFAADGDQMNATIPFNFTVGDQQFTAGRYRLEQLGGALIVRSVTGKGAAILHTETDSHREAATKNTLRFQRDGSDLVLQSVVKEGSKDEVQVRGLSRRHHSDAVAAASAQ